MITYKGFKKGLICRGYQFVPYAENVCDKAQAHETGFHSAENPLDVLSYYGIPEEAEYWMCEALGDIDEDGRDSKVSSTVLIPRVKLTLEELLFLGCRYVFEHPETGTRYDAQSEARCGYALAIGDAPKVMGRKQGDVLCAMNTETGEIGIGVVGVNGITAGKWYGKGVEEFL